MRKHAGRSGLTRPMSCSSSAFAASGTLSRRGRSRSSVGGSPAACKRVQAPPAARVAPDARSPPTADRRRRLGHQRRVGQKQFQQLLLCGRRLAAVSAAPLSSRRGAGRPRRRAPRLRVRSSSRRAHTVSSLSTKRRAIRLTINCVLTAPACPGNGGARAMMPSTASTARRLSSTPGGAAPRQHLIQLELQRVHRLIEHPAKGVRPLLHQQIARIESGRQRGDRQIDVVAGEQSPGRDRRRCRRRRRRRRPAPRAARSGESAEHAVRSGPCPSSPPPDRRPSGAPSARRCSLPRWPGSRPWRPPGAPGRFRTDARSC